MKIRKVKAQAREFARKHRSAAVIQVMVNDPAGLVVDIGEFQITGHPDLAWDPEDRVHGIAEWLADRRTWATCELLAMDAEYESEGRITFELCGSSA